MLSFGFILSSGFNFDLHFSTVLAAVYDIVIPLLFHIDMSCVSNGLRDLQG